MHNLRAIPIDLAPMHRSMIGFDRIGDMIEDLMSDETETGYPPHNIEKTEEGKYRISLAVAGFDKEDLSVEIENSMLVVTGKTVSKDPDRNFLHRGIANRAFRQQFKLDDHVHVTGASHENGMLNIDLEREMPEALKPRRVEINSASSRSSESDKTTIAA